MTARVEKSSSVHGDVLDLGLAARLHRLEGARADEREPRLAFPGHVDVDGVLQRGPLAHQLAVAQLEVDEVPVEPRAQAGGEAGGDVGRQHGRAEEDGVEALPLHEPGEHVDARLRERRGERRIVGGVGPRGAVAAGLRGELRDPGAGHDRGHVPAELRCLREDAERALDELALVVFEEDERGH